MGVGTAVAAGLGATRTGAGLGFRISIFRFRVVIRIKSRAFKDYAAACTDKPLYFLMALWAFFKRFIGYLLEDVKYFIAIRAFVFISRHFFSKFRSGRLSAR